MNEKPIYVSKPTSKSLWNEYRIYQDRIELEARFLFRTFVVDRNDLVAIALYKPPVFKTKFWALKIDCADLNEHVGVERTSGFMKNIRFTPESPKQFVETVQRAWNISCI